MSFTGILRYSLSALMFASGFLLLFCLARRMCGRNTGPSLALLVFSTAAVVQITGLRMGLRPWRFLSGELHWIPLESTLGVAKRGWWMLTYHTIGNLAWFVPIGFFWRRLRPKQPLWRAMAAGALLSVLVECLQYLLGTGVSDIDDVLLNALGTLLGAWAARRGGAGKPKPSNPSERTIRQKDRKPPVH